MANSMTGYGRSVMTVNETSITVEVRTVNHRFLDISIKTPRSLLFIEEKVKKTIQSFFHRGRIDVFINLEGDQLKKQDLTINWRLLEQYINSLEQIKEHYQLAGEVPIATVMQMDGVYAIQESQQLDDTYNEVILKGVIDACKQTIDMREIEGKQLVKDLNERNKLIKQLIKQLGERRDLVIIEYRDRISKRIEEYLNDKVSSDESRVYQEIALLAEKGDITEEVTRLNSHTDQLDNGLNQEGPIGRKLDFIVQEMHREANTIGSKSNDIHIGEIVVALKSEVEKLKEQIQNIE